MNKSLSLLIVSLVYISVSAQDSTSQKKFTVLVDLAQPFISQVQVGVLRHTKSKLSFFVFGRYNINYIPNHLSYAGYDDGNPSFSFPYYGRAQVSGFTVGGQIRRDLKMKSEKELTEYKKLLKPNKRVSFRPEWYVGAWAEYGISEYVTSLPERNYFVGTAPDAVRRWTNVFGGPLIGFRSNLSSSIVLDVYTGVGYRSLESEMLLPNARKVMGSTYEIEYDGTMAYSTYNASSVIGRVGIQLGYRF